jgi:outer membrane lipoprotein-sorting protein
MRPAEKIEKFIKNVPLETKAERDREVLEDALRALKESKERDKRQPTIWKAIMKNRMTKIAAAASIILAVLIGIGTFDRTSAWAEVLKAFSEVGQFYLESTTIFPDGHEKQEKYWLRKPDGLREENSQRMIIDNGKERLTLDRKNKEAQFEDSFLEYRPVSAHYMFEHTEIFRGQEMKGLTVKKLKDQSNGTTSVFRLDYKNSLSQDTYRGKAWVDNQTMLPIRIKLQLQNEQKEDRAKVFDEFFDYSPIPDDVFEPVVPDEYTVLPRRRSQAISGKVVDAEGSPAQSATVHLTDKWLRFLRKVETDGAGEFLFKLPPSKVHWVGLPLFLRAVPPNDPGRVAWTIVEDPAKKKYRGIEIPGQTGQVDVGDGGLLQGVNGIVLKMESAGTISGRVTAMDGEPISGAEVKIQGRAFVRERGLPIYPEFGFIGHPLGGEGPRGELTARTDEQGGYNVTNVPKLSKRNWYQISAGGVSGFSSNYTRIERTAWETDVERADIQLYRTGITVSGTLVDNYGQALGMRRIFGRVGDRDFCDAKTDKEGRFVLKDCPVSSELQIKAALSHNTWPPHEKEKYGSYTYYPNVIVPVDYQEGQMEYEVELVAEKPEAAVEVNLKNTQGETLPLFPVEIRGAPGSISSQWEADKRFRQRTDEKGYCRFTEVPNVEDLRLVLWGGNSVWNDRLSGEEAQKVRNKYEKYQWTEVPIEFNPEQKEYKIKVTLPAK